VLLTQSKLQIAHGQVERALATLRRLQEHSPGHAYGIKLLARVYEQLGEWRNLEALIPRLRKTNVIRPADFERIEVRTLQEAFISGAADGPAVLDATWRNTPRRMRKNRDVILAYTAALIQNDAGDRAEAVLRDALKAQWDDELVLMYGEVLSS